MFKNCIIVFQFFLLSSLLIQKPDNAKLLIKDLATSKEMVLDGAEYVKQTFSKEFSVIEENKNLGDKIDLSKANPFYRGEPVYEQHIEETWVNER
jgi:hypothetical protein